MAPLRDPEIATCPYTGLTIPECCCYECLEDQVRRHRPAVLNQRLGAAGPTSGASVPAATPARSTSIAPASTNAAFS